MNELSYIPFALHTKKNIALIAHDEKKNDLANWALENQEELSRHELSGTGTTAKLITEKTGLPVRGYNSGPLGGDQQIGARIAEGRIDFLIFFWDPLAAQPHDPDVRALLRIAVLYDIPVAMNRATANFMMTSGYMEQTYERRVLNYNQAIQKRFEKMKDDM